MGAKAGEAAQVDTTEKSRILLRGNTSCQLTPARKNTLLSPAATPDSRSAMVSVENEREREKRKERWGRRDGLAREEVVSNLRHGPMQYIFLLSWGLFLFCFFFLLESLFPLTHHLQVGLRSQAQRQIAHPWAGSL